MPALNLAALAALLAFAVGQRASAQRSGSERAQHAEMQGEDLMAGMSSPCPSGTIPDDDLCVPLPASWETSGDELASFPGGHHDKQGRWQSYEQIPRRPERAEPYGVYRYPIAFSASERVMSGYDLDLPDEEQRRGRRLSHVGHGGVDLPAPRGTPVTLVRLEHEEGDTSVLSTGKLFGNTVLTRHTVREGGRLRDYVVLYGHLDAIAQGLSQGARVREGDVLGFVGDSGSEGIVHLHLEVRRVREGLDVARLPSARVLANEISVVCDPRNVLPLR